MLTATFGESTKSRIQVQLWYKCYKEVRLDVNDVASPGRESTSTIDDNNRRITIGEAAVDVGISFGLCQQQHSY